MSSNLERLIRQSRTSRAKNVHALVNYLNRQPTGLAEFNTIGWIQDYVGYHPSPEDKAQIEADFSTLEALMYNLQQVLDALNQAEREAPFLRALQEQFVLYGDLTDDERTEATRLARILNRALKYFPSLVYQFQDRTIPLNPRNIEMLTVMMTMMSSVMKELVQCAQRLRHTEQPDMSHIQEWITDIRQLIQAGEILPEFVPEIRQESQSIGYDLVQSLNRLRFTQG